jgi:hypothetical protein
VGQTRYVCPQQQVSSPFSNTSAYRAAPAIPGSWRNNTGTLRDQHGRPVSFGLCKGSADLIGYRTITITPDMVGQQVAVFASIEVKTPTGRIRPEQQAWLETVQAAGGIAGVARSVEDALRIMTAHG